MNVRCPECTTEYTIPEHLLGGRGARVRCPMCDHGFVVLREVGGAAGAFGTAVAVSEDEAGDDAPLDPSALTLASEHAEATAELAVAERLATEASSEGFSTKDAEAMAAQLEGTAAPAAEHPENAAHTAERMLDGLAQRLGDGLAEAQREGRVLSAFGAEIVKVWDDYRKGQGEAAAAMEFRAALRERFGVDLTGRPR
jgi:predicted Zn finger-like uncharacterized protein